MTLAEEPQQSLDSSSNSDEKADAALFSKVDLTINGKGTLNVDGKRRTMVSRPAAPSTPRVEPITSQRLMPSMSMMNSTSWYDHDHRCQEDGVKVDNDEDTSV